MGMLKALVMYYELAITAVEEGGYTWTKLREATNDVWFQLTQMKFEDPVQGESASLPPRKLADPSQSQFRPTSRSSTPTLRPSSRCVAHCARRR